jgi:hypothetical protein
VVELVGLAIVWSVLNVVDKVRTAEKLSDLVGWPLMFVLLIGPPWIVALWFLCDPT